MSGTTSAVISAFGRLDRELSACTAGVNRALGCVPDWLLHLLGQVHEKWQEFCNATQRFFALVNEVLSYGLGDEEALRAAAVAWSETAGAALEAAHEALSHDAIKADTSWRGAAGSKYAEGFQDQIDAVHELKDFTIDLGGRLEDHAAALELFKGNITAGLIGAAVSLAGLVVSIIALVPPITPIGIVGIIVSAIGLIVSLFFLFKNELDDLDRISQIGAEALERARDQAAQPWPKFVSV